MKWPAGLKRLFFGANFKQKIEAADWPDTLEHLEFGSYFNLPVEAVKWCVRPVMNTATTNGKHRYWYCGRYPFSRLASALLSSRCGLARDTSLSSLVSTPYSLALESNEWFNCCRNGTLFLDTSAAMAGRSPFESSCSGLDSTSRSNTAGEGKCFVSPAARHLLVLVLRLH